MAPVGLVVLASHILVGLPRVNAFRNTIFKVIRKPDPSFDKNAKTSLQRIEDNVRLVQKVYRSLNDSTVRMASNSIARDTVLRVVDSFTGELTTRAADVVFPSHGHHDPMYWGLKAFLYDFSMAIWSNSLYRGETGGLPFILRASLPNQTMSSYPSYLVSDNPSFSAAHPSPLTDEQRSLVPRYLVPSTSTSSDTEFVVSRVNRLFCYLLARFMALILLHTVLHVTSDAIVHATFLNFSDVSDAE